MADKTIGELTQAESIGNEDLFVLEQGGEAKKLKGETLLDFVTLSVVSVTVTTLPAGSSATATYDKSTGTLYLGIPQGEQGDAAPTITNITIRQSDYHMIVTLSDGTSYDAGYCRGASGEGTGDMLASTYDPQGKAQDIFSYADAKYSKPSGGIPKTDLASDVQTSLGKADSALQSVPANYRTASAQDEIDNGKQNQITASGILKGDGAGGVSAAVNGTDYAEPSVAFTVTLSASGWSGNAQTVSDARFLTNGYAYSVAPDSGSFAAYGKAVIYADNVTTAGQMQFHCGEVPTADLTVNILRMEVSA